MALYAAFYLMASIPVDETTINVEKLATLQFIYRGVILWRIIIFKNGIAAFDWRELEGIAVSMEVCNAESLIIFHQFLKTVNGG